jgi:threonine aldolase
MFGSDNQAGASAKVLAALTEAYQGPAGAYGDDEFTAAVAEALRSTFDTDLEAFFVSSGTAANMLALSAMVQPWDGVICHHQAHILLDESTGPALFTGGAAMLPTPDRTVRMTADQLTDMVRRLPSEIPHNVRARALSITQANECGQVYSAAETAALAAVANDAGLAVHLDGARFANAVVAAEASPADLTWKAGVDVLCLGASKNGAVAAEAIVFFDTALAEDFGYRLKRTGHLTSKGRLYGAQFTAWLGDEHWLDLARAANTTAERLRTEIERTNGMRLAWPCQSNETFVIFERPVYRRLAEAGVSMYEWYPNSLPADQTLADTEVLARLVTSFATTDADIDAFLEHAGT